ncbi:MAG TPA: hemerythrin domain-containing protein [Azospirillum sp.]|nr:hemerythrin domain-containing protein [Azospirillum sp.]
MYEHTTQIGRLLHDDHQRCLSAVQNLEALLARQGPRKPADLADPKTRSVLVEAKGVLSQETATHFAFEEDHLFPLLAEVGEQHMILTLKSEHDAIAPIAEDVVRLIADALKAGSFTPEAWTELHDLGLELTERQVFHVQKEEMGLLSGIGMMLEPDVDSRLADTYRSMG